MLIKDLKEDYPLVYEAALNNQVKDGNKKNDSYSLMGGFVWSSSKENDTFWVYIDNKDFDKAKELCPHLFEDKISNEIPEYIEAIDNYASYFIKGNIYKLLGKEITNSTELVSNIKCDGFNPGNSLYVNLRDYDNWKPSTKEAYKAQNKIEKEWIPKVGDWVYILDTGCQITNSLENVRLNQDVVKLYESNLSNYDYNFSLTPDGESKIAFCNGEESKFLRKALPHEIPTETEVKYKNKDKVVHVDTQEKWDFVVKNEKSDVENVWENLKKDACLNLNNGNHLSYARIDFYKSEKYKILSFDEYLSLNLLHEEWESFIQQQFIGEAPVNNKVDYSNYFVKDEWYVVDVGNSEKDEWLFKFKSLDNGDLNDYVSVCINSCHKYLEEGTLCGIDELKSTRKATREEVEKYFPGEFSNDWNDVPLETCEECKGEGRVMVGKLYPTGHHEVIEDCENCNGLGKVEYNGNYSTIRKELSYKKDEFIVKGKSENKFESISNSYSYLPELKQKSKKFKF